MTDPEIQELLAKARALTAARRKHEQATRDAVRELEAELRENRDTYDAEWGTAALQARRRA